MPVRTWTVLIPAAEAGAAASSQAAATSARNPSPPLAVLGQDLVTPVGAVETDRRRGDEGAQPAGDRAASVASARVGPVPARQDLSLALRREPAADRGAREMNHRVHAVQAGPGRGRPAAIRARPSSRGARRTSRITRWPPVVSSAARADPTTPLAPGERDRQRLRAHLPRPRVSGQVRLELPVPVAEHRPQHSGRDGRGDDIRHDRCPRCRRGAKCGYAASGARPRGAAAGHRRTAAAGRSLPDHGPPPSAGHRAARGPPARRGPKMPPAPRAPAATAASGA